MEIEAKLGEYALGKETKLMGQFRLKKMEEVSKKEIKNGSDPGAPG